MEKEHSIIWIKTCIYKKKVERDSILYFKAEDRKVNVYLNAGELKEIRHTLANLEEMLPKDKFFRCNRQVIVNVDYVDQFSEKIPEIILTNGEKISVAKDRKDDLSKLLDCN